MEYTNENIDTNGYDEEVIGKVKKLMDSRSGYWSRDVEDLDTSRSLSSGFGFDEDDRKYRGELKPEVTVNRLRSWVDQVVAAYDLRPFVLNIKSQKGADAGPLRWVFDDIQETSDITELASECLRDAVNDGWAYLLVTAEVENEELNWQKPIIKKIDARQVVVDFGNDLTLKDCDIAIVIDVIKKDRAEDMYGIDEDDLQYNNDILKGYDLHMDPNTQCSVITCYELIHNKGVQITKIVHHKIVDQTTIPQLKRLPLIRCCGEAVYVDKEKHYRGAYHFVADLLKLLNYTTSEEQARIAQSETANWAVDRKSIANNPNDWKQGSNSLVKGFDSWDGNEQLQAPVRVDKALQLQELIVSKEATTVQIADILGAPTTQAVAGETAEGVLTRRAVAEASTNRYIKNLKTALKQVGEVILQYMGVLYDVPRIDNGRVLPALSGQINAYYINVDEGPLVAGQRIRELEQLLALNDMLIKTSQDPLAKKMFGVILDAADVSEEYKQEIRQAIVAGEINQQQIEQMSLELEATKQNLVRASDYIRQLETHIQKEEQKLAVERMKISADLMKNESNNETKVYIEERKLGAQAGRQEIDVLAGAVSDYRNAEAKLEQIEAQKPVEQKIQEQVVRRIQQVGRVR
jgi:hypothetical protein